jgi:hypothetical protein
LAGIWLCRFEHQVNEESLKGTFNPALNHGDSIHESPHSASVELLNHHLCWVLMLPSSPSHNTRKIWGKYFSDKNKLLFSACHSLSTRWQHFFSLSQLFTVSR